MDKQYEVLCVSQFTLQCVLKGNKPDFHLAMPTEQAESFYNSFLEQMRRSYRPELIKDGETDQEKGCVTSGTSNCGWIEYSPEPPTSVSTAKAACHLANASESCLAQP